MNRLLAIVFLVFSVTTVFAVSDAEQLDSIARLFTMEEISVVASRPAKDVITAQHLDGARLLELNAHSVADALRYFSGVQIKDYGGIGGIKTIDLRSMGSHHVGVFYDGIEVGNAQNGTVDLGKFSLDNIEQISLYNGQKTDGLQTAKDFGNAGTLYVRTRRPVFTDNKTYNVSLTMKAGSFGLANPSLLYEQKLTDNIHLSANAEYTFSTGRYRFNIKKYYPNGQVAWDTTGIRQNGDVESFRAEAGIFGYLPTGKWHLKGYYYQSEKGIPRAIVRNVWTSAQRQWDRNAFFQGSFQYNVANRWELLLSGKYSNDKMRYLNPDTTLMHIDNTFLQHEAYVSWANKVQVFDWWDLSLSADYLFNKLESNMPNFVDPIRHTGLLAVATSFHYKWIQTQASILGTFVRDVLLQPNSMLPQLVKQKPRFTPAVFISYQPWLKEKLFVRAFYKQIFRMPTFNDLYYTDLGNINLEPEFTRQYDAGVEYSKRLNLLDLNCKAITMNMKIDGYFNQVENKIVAIPKGNSQYRWMMMNIGYVEIQGVDLNLGMEMEFAHHVILGLNGTYTYQRAKDLTYPDDPVTYGGQIAYVPWHSCSATAHLSWDGLTFNYSFIYVGERYHNSANIPANYEQPWYTHDLAIGYKWKISVASSGYAFWLDTSVEINNIFNQQYDVILNYPMPGTNGKVILKFIF